MRTVTNQKPNPGTRLRYNQYFAKNLLSAWLLNEKAGSGVFNSVTGKVEVINAGTWVEGGFKPGTDLNPITISPISFVSPMLPFAIQLRVKCYTFGGTADIFTGDTSAIGYIGFFTNGTVLRVKDTNNQNLDFNYTFTVNTYYTILIQNFGTSHPVYPNDYEFFVNGISLGIKASAAGLIIKAIGNGYTNTSYIPNGIIDHVYVWSGRNFTKQEALLLHQKPYEMFQSRPISYYYVVAAGGGFIPYPLDEERGARGGLKVLSGGLQ
ncbi:MAG: hypothetical protein KJ954_13720 [Alphaproteobacteria bacterium]|nr:hypothetical protein [Alphaproteobacteria bacterium]